MGWILIICGVFSICGAALNLDLFMNNRRTRFFVRIFGRNGARVFYGLLGSALVVVGFLLALGIIESK